MSGLSAQNILAYSATSRGDMHGITWNAQRDQRQYLSLFGSSAFRMTTKVFLTPAHTFATLYDDLYGSKASENQVKTLNARNVDREGHTADAIAFALL